MADHVLQAGAPDPERKISPILDEYEEISLDMESKRESAISTILPTRLARMS